jgi:DNA-binding response OmpR family regulator
VLTLLVVDAGRVVARQRLMQEVWDEHYFGSTRTLDMHISSLRRKLGDDPTSPRLITTVRGVGFRFETG